MITLGTRLHDFFQSDIHVGVAADEMAVESFAGFELDEHGVALGCGEEAEGQHGWNEWVGLVV